MSIATLYAKFKPKNLGGALRSEEQIPEIYYTRSRRWEGDTDFPNRMGRTAAQCTKKIGDTGVSGDFENEEDGGSGSKLARRIVRERGG